MTKPYLCDEMDDLFKSYFVQLYDTLSTEAQKVLLKNVDFVYIGWELHAKAVG